MPASTVQCHLTILRLQQESNKCRLSLLGARTGHCISPVMLLLFYYVLVLDCTACDYLA